MKAVQGLRFQEGWDLGVVSAVFVHLGGAARGVWIGPGVLQGGDVGQDVLRELVLSPLGLHAFRLPQKKRKKNLLVTPNSNYYYY